MSELKALLKTIEDGDVNNESLKAVLLKLAGGEVNIDSLIETVKQEITNKDKLLTMLATKCYENDLYEFVLPLLQESFEINNHNIDTLYNLGYVLFQIGKNDMALQFLNMIKEKDEDIVKLISRIKESEQNQLPLVSVLIPAYNRPHYLELAVQSVLKQTYKNIEIVICDDSTNDEVQTMIKPYVQKYPQIRYYKNEKNLYAENPHKCFDLSRGEYINFLFDDDLFHETKIEKMMAYFLQNENITLVTSYRQLIDFEGKYLDPIDATKRLFDRDTVLNGKSFGDYVLVNCLNVIGEPSTVLFRKKDLTEKFGIYKGRQYMGPIDIVAWLILLAKGNAVYISEPLSFFRQHPGQNQQSVEVIRKSFGQWVYLLDDAREDGFLNLEEDYKSALNAYLRKCTNIIQLAIKNRNQDLLEEAYDTCNKLLERIIQTQDKHFCHFCNSSFKSFIPWPDIFFDFPGYEFEMSNKYAICPKCRSHDRERLCRLYIENETDLVHADKKVLHIAPEPNLRKWLSGNTKLQYVCGDLFPRDDQTVELDATNINYSDNSFDVIICSHVLEHIPDDLKAMQELYRVLKVGGWGVLQVPISISIDKTYEDFSVTTPEERKRVFGQADHVRIYARDYVDRLKAAGFTVKTYNHADKFGALDAEKYGLEKNDNLYIVCKE